MTGREEKRYNDLFFLCSLIEYVARKTTNERKTIVNAMGYDGLKHIYDLAEVYHSENIDKLTFEIVSKYSIPSGTFDNVASCKYNVPTHWDIGKVFQRLIINICKETGRDPVAVLMEVYNSWIANNIENYNSSMYYENPGYHLASWKAGRPL